MIGLVPVVSEEYVGGRYGDFREGLGRLVAGAYGSVVVDRRRRRRRGRGRGERGVARTARIRRSRQARRWWHRSGHVTAAVTTTGVDGVAPVDEHHFSGLQVYRYLLSEGTRFHDAVVGYKRRVGGQRGVDTRTAACRGRRRGGRWFERGVPRRRFRWFRAFVAHFVEVVALR